MTRRRAAWIAAVVAVLLGATYLMTRRRRAAPEIPAFSPPASTPTPIAPAAVTASASEPEPATTAPLSVKTKPEPRSWGATRAVPARTPPPVAEESATAVDVEHPLPTWIRAAIVVAALAAFFAVSLIATKHV